MGNVDLNRWAKLAGIDENQLNEETVTAANLDFEKLAAILKLGMKTDNSGEYSEGFVIDPYDGVNDIKGYLKGLQKLGKVLQKGEDEFYDKWEDLQDDAVGSANWDDSLEDKNREKWGEIINSLNLEWDVNEDYDSAIAGWNNLAKAVNNFKL